MPKCIKCNQYRKKSIMNKDNICEDCQRVMVSKDATISDFVSGDKVHRSFKKGKKNEI